MQLMERWLCSARPYKGPESGKSSRLAELQSSGVGDLVNDPGDSTVLYVVNTRRKSKLQGLGSRGAWEGRLHPRGRGTSVRGEGRRRCNSSLSSGDRSEVEQSPLATPLPGEGSVPGQHHHTIPKQGRRMVESSMEVTRGHELQPDSSADHVLGSAYAGQQSFAAPSMHASVGAYAGQGSLAAPLARRAEELMSKESDDAGGSGELSGEVHSILNSRDGVRRRVRIIDSPNLGITYNGGWCSATIAR